MNWYGSLDTLGTIVKTLTDGTNIDWDMKHSRIAKVTLGGNRNLNNPTNKHPNDFFLFVRQDATGSRTLSFSSDYKFPGNVSPVLSTAANAVDVIHFVYDGTTLAAVANFSFGSAP